MSIVEPAPTDASWPRYCGLPFPSYRFIPGLNPHPRRDPRGHAYGTPERPPPRFAPEDWRRNEVYLYGIDLYNFAYWWECHEALEGLWHLTGHRGTESQFLQGIIQVAAANLKRHVSATGGARRLAGEAVERLGSVDSRVWMGLELGPFIEEVRAYHLEERPVRVPLIRLQSRGPEPPPVAP